MDDLDVLEELLRTAGDVGYAPARGGNRAAVQRRKLLVVDDEPRVLELAEQLNERWGLGRADSLGIARAVVAGRTANVAILSYGRGVALGYASRPWPMLTPRADPGLRLVSGGDVLDGITDQELARRHVGVAEDRSSAVGTDGRP